MVNYDNTAAPAAVAPGIAAHAQGSNPANTISQQPTIHGQQDSEAISDQTATSSNAEQSRPASNYDMGANIVHAMAVAAAAIDSPTAAALHNAAVVPQPSHRNGANDADVGMAGDGDLDGGVGDSAAEQDDSVMTNDEEGDSESDGNEDTDVDSDEYMDDNDEDQDTAAASVQPFTIQEQFPRRDGHAKWPWLMGSTSSCASHIAHHPWSYSSPRNSSTPKPKTGSITSQSSMLMRQVVSPTRAFSKKLSVRSRRPPSPPWRTSAR